MRVQPAPHLAAFDKLPRAIKPAVAQEWRDRIASPDWEAQFERSQVVRRAGGTPQQVIDAAKPIPGERPGPAPSEWPEIMFQVIRELAPEHAS